MAFLAMCLKDQKGTRFMIDINFSKNKRIGRQLLKPKIPPKT